MRGIPASLREGAASIAFKAGRRGRGPLLVVLSILGLGLMLGACSKCDVPVWQHSSATGALDACHDGPAPQ